MSISDRFAAKLAEIISQDETFLDILADVMSGQNGEFSSHVNYDIELRPGCVITAHFTTGAFTKLIRDAADLCDDGTVEPPKNTSN